MLHVWTRWEEGGWALVWAGSCLRCESGLLAPRCHSLPSPSLMLGSVTWGSWMLRVLIIALSMPPTSRIPRKG